MARNTKVAEPKGGEIFESSEALADRLTKTEEFLEKHKIPVAIVGGAILLVILGILGYRYYITNQNDIAQRELFQAVYYFEQDSLGLALNGDGNNYGFLDVISNYGATKAGNLANFYAGATYLQLGDQHSAIRYFEDFGSSDLLLQARTYSLIGDAHMELGDYQEAANNFEKAAGYNENKEFSPGYFMKAGLAYELLGDYESAFEMYDRVVSKYFDSSEYQEARKQRARIEPLASR